MADKKPNRQLIRKKQAARAARAAALARRRRQRQRWLKIGAGVVVGAGVVGLAVILMVNKGDDPTTVTSSTSTTAPSTSTDPADEAPASADGKPCVPVAGALPAGAPKVPVRVGEPPTKLVTEDLKQGTGALVTASQTLTVNYIGVSCSTGKIFDSSYKTGTPATFPLSGVIPGWQQGIPGMKVGGQRLLGIPPDLGYGEQGSGADIAPNETLWFVVEVLEAK